MSSFEANRLHASDAARLEHAARLAHAFDLYLRSASPALAQTLADATARHGTSGTAAIIVAAILEIADRLGPGDAVAAFDACRQSGRGSPRNDAVMGHALIGALKDVLGPAFDEATREAWANGYVRLVEAVMAARRNRMDFVA